MIRHRFLITLIIIAAIFITALSPAIPAYAKPLDNLLSHLDPTDSSGKGLLNLLLGLLVGNLLSKIINVIPGLSDSLGLPASMKANGKDVLGFYAEWWDDDTSSYNSLNTHRDTLNCVVPFWATLQSDGSLADRGGKDHKAVVKFANQNHITALLMVNNAAQKPGNSGIHRVLASPRIRATAVDNLETNLKKYKLDGINIDFESVPPEDREYLTAFMKELSARLKPQGYIISVDVMPKTDESNDISAAYDYRQLAKYADKIIVMAYDNHGEWSDAGPVAGINWVEDNLKYALQFIPKDKLYLGLAGYGYDWSGKGVESIDYPSIKELTTQFGVDPQWDEQSKSPYFHYTDANDRPHTVWYENSQSIGYKLALVNQYDLAGVALWKLGEEDPDDWGKIQDELHKQ